MGDTGARTPGGQTLSVRLQRRCGLGGVITQPPRPASPSQGKVGDSSADTFPALPWEPLVSCPGILILERDLGETSLFW